MTMTLREVFETVKQHLLEQMAISENIDGSYCAYRSPDGLKCAAGCLIDDEHYSKDFETLLANDPEVWGALVASGVPDTETAKELVRELQLLHDRGCPYNWAGELESLEDCWFPDND